MAWTLSERLRVLDLEVGLPGLVWLLNLVDNSKRPASSSLRPVRFLWFCAGTKWKHLYKLMCQAIDVRRTSIYSINYPRRGMIKASNFTLSSIS